MNLSLRLGAALSLAGLFGCASTVDGIEPGADAGVRDDGATVAPEGCAHWALTDREERSDGELYTDLHVTFDAQGRLATRRENIRTGGHGIDRTAQSFTYAWSATGLTITKDGDPTERTVYALDGDRVTARTRESSQSSLRAAMTWERDDRGRVVARTETRDGMAPTRCTWRYDAAGHITEVACSDGDLSRYRWEGDRPVRRDHTYQGRNPGFDTWEWNARGALVRERHDDGWGPGRLYRYDHTYDAAGRVLRSAPIPLDDHRRFITTYRRRNAGRCEGLLPKTLYTFQCHTGSGRQY